MRRSGKSVKRRRIVVDTNVLVSGLLWSGPPALVLDAVAQGRLTLIFSPLLATEFYGVLTRPKFLAQFARIEQTPAETYLSVLEHAELIEPALTLSFIPDETVDNDVLAVAVTAGVDAIVSGDHHLLDVGQIAGIPILTPRRFLNWLVKQGN